MDEFRGYYAKQNKSRVKQIPCDFTYTCNLKNNKQNRNKLR